MLVSGVYAIRNLLNGKVYVGSAVNIRLRWAVHQANLRAGKHHSRYLQNAWNKYGGNAFGFYVVELVAPKGLLSAEQRWLSVFNSFNPANGYNLCSQAGSGLGHRHTAATRKKISEKALLVASSPEGRRQRSERAKRQWETGVLNGGLWKGHMPKQNQKLKLWALSPEGREHYHKISERMKQSNPQGFRDMDALRERTTLAWQEGRMRSPEWTPEMRQRVSSTLRERAKDSEWRRLLSERAKAGWARRRGSKEKTGYGLLSL